VYSVLVLGCVHRSARRHRTAFVARPYRARETTDPATLLVPPDASPLAEGWREGLRLCVVRRAPHLVPCTVCVYAV